jgi:hypothetical protein
MQNNSPAVLVAILIAARRVRDRDLERTARAELESAFGIRIRFLSNRTYSALRGAV